MARIPKGHRALRADEPLTTPGLRVITLLGEVDSTLDGDDVDIPPGCVGEILASNRPDAWWQIRFHQGGSTYPTTEDLRDPLQYLLYVPV